MNKCQTLNSNQSPPSIFGIYFILLSQAPYTIMSKSTPASGLVTFQNIYIYILTDEVSIKLLFIENLTLNHIQIPILNKLSPFPQGLSSLKIL